MPAKKNDPEPVDDEEDDDPKPTKAAKTKADPHDHPHDHSKEHPTRKELEELRQHKHEPETPAAEIPTPAVIDKPPPEVKQEKQERVGRGILF